MKGKFLATALTLSSIVSELNAEHGHMLWLVRESGVLQKKLIGPEWACVFQHLQLLQQWIGVFENFQMRLERVLNINYNKTSFALITVYGEVEWEKNIWKTLAEIKTVENVLKSQIICAKRTCIGQFCSKRWILNYFDILTEISMVLDFL